MRREKIEGKEIGRCNHYMVFLEDIFAYILI
jgi:hypothetical protein